MMGDRGKAYFIRVPHHDAEMIDAIREWEMITGAEFWRRALAVWKAVNPTLVERAVMQADESRRMKSNQMQFDFDERDAE